MLRLLTFLTLLMNILPLAAQDQLIAERNDGWNSFEMDWFFRDSLEYGYSQEGELLFVNIRDFEDGAWPYAKRLANTYDEMGNQLSSTEFTRIDGSWQVQPGDERLRWEYNELGQETLDLSEVWDGADWQPESREISTYQLGSNYLEERLGQDWFDGGWQNVYRIQFVEYDAMGNLLLEVQEWWEEEAWQPHVRLNRSYDGAGALTEQLVETYLEGNWRPAFRRTFEYNNDGHQLGYLQESWKVETQNWSPSYREMYNLDEEGNRLNFLSQSWAPSEEEWRNLILGEYTYNPDGQNTFTLTQRWNSTAGVWENLDRSYYYYGDGITDVAEPPKDGVSNLKIYPNPTDGQFFVKIKSEQPQKGQLRLMSINGQTLSVFNINNGGEDKLMLDLGNFPAGKYVIQLVGERHRSSSVVILK